VRPRKYARQTFRRMANMEFPVVWAFHSRRFHGTAGGPSTDHHIAATKRAPIPSIPPYNSSPPILRVVPLPSAARRLRLQQRVAASLLTRRRRRRHLLRSAATVPANSRLYHNTTGAYIPAGVVVSYIVPAVEPRPSTAAGPRQPGPPQRCSPTARRTDRANHLPSPSAVLASYLVSGTQVRSSYYYVLDGAYHE
jgi:hypothetical protein